MIKCMYAYVNHCSIKIIMAVLNSYFKYSAEYE